MNKAVEKKLREINKRVPKELQDAVTKVVYVAPDLRNEVIEVLAEPATTPGEEKHKRRLQNLFDAGHYDLTETVVDADVAKKIEKWVDKEIKAAIKAGEIPDPKDDKKLSKYVKKSQRNERRKQKSSIRSKQGAKGASIV